MNHKIIIIGAGASGITAAITAKDMGCDVAIVESNNRIGKKILITGNGQCNITNAHINVKRYHSNNSNFFENIIKSFNYKDTVNFFYSLGLPITALDDGRMYPMSLQASSVVDILKTSLEERKIPIYLNSKIVKIKKLKDKFILTNQNKETFECDKLILACGGKSYPKTGSDGSGYELAKILGHNIITPLPALVQLKLNYNRLKALSGIRFYGNAELITDNTSVSKQFGEILFTNYGISGPAILQLSRFASIALEKNKNVKLKIDIMPKFNKQSLINFLENHWGTFGYRSVSSSLIGIINKRFIPILLKQAGVELHKACFDLTWKEKSNIYNLLKSWTFEVIGTNGFNNSQVTCGGVDTSNINNITLESKITPNLYFCGEILDVDGDCGGFNLQWAWSSGFTAGKYASK